MLSLGHGLTGDNMNTCRKYTFTMTPKDNEKLTFIKDAEGMTSKSDVLRRLIDRSYMQLKREARKNAA